MTRNENWYFGHHIDTNFAGIWLRYVYKYSIPAKILTSYRNVLFRGGPCGPPLCPNGWGGEYLILLSCVKTSKVNASFKSFFFSSSFFVFQEQQIKLPITLPIASTGQSLFHQLRSEMPHRIEVSGGNLWPTASQPNSDDDEIKLHLTANPNSMPSRRLSLPTIMHTTGGWMKTVKQLEI